LNNEKSILIFFLLEEIWLMLWASLEISQINSNLFMIS
jgi:hypothetical protein